MTDHRPVTGCRRQHDRAPQWLPKSAQALYFKHDWCPTCHRGWEFAPPAPSVAVPDAIRNTFAEITFKAIAVTDPTGDDPDRVRHYIVPVGPMHRAAGTIGHQMFDGERLLASASADASRYRAALTEIRNQTQHSYAFPVQSDDAADTAADKEIRKVHEIALTALADQSSALITAPQDDVREALEAIAQAEQMLSEHIEQYHDGDFEPHNEPPARRSLRDIQYHLAGAMINDDDLNSLSLSESDGPLYQRDRDMIADEAYDIGWRDGNEAALRGNQSDGGQEHHGRSAELIGRVATPADADPKHWPSREDPVQVDRLAPSDTTPSRPEVDVEELRDFIYVRQPCYSMDLARALKAKYHMEGRE
jgi:hypothetical protein